MTAMQSSVIGVSPAAGEPTAERMRDPLKRYLSATRPAFLTITLVGCVLGIACARADGVAVSLPIALLTLLLGATAHAAVNVYNDYCDHLNGTDAINTGRIFPFTGGSRFIQNGVLTPLATLLFARILFLFTICGGIVLAWRVGVGLLWIGVAGMLIGWAYSAPPLRLNSRGLGELMVALAFVLVVVGADHVQRGSFSMTPAWAGIGYALLTTNILYINQFPDRDADIAAGKHHLVARLPVAQARWGYLLLVILAALAMALPVAFGALPRAAALGLIAIVPAALAARSLLRFAATPQALAPAIQQTIAAAHLAALAMAVGLWFS